MSKSELTELKELVASLQHRVALLEAFVDPVHRDKLGLDLASVREIWHGKPSSAEPSPNPDGSMRRSLHQELQAKRQGVPREFLDLVEKADKVCEIGRELKAVSR
jgi:hypothetical protein